MALICSTAALVLTTPAFAADACSGVAGNLLVNCGFETGDFTGWQMTTANYTGVDRSTPFSGNYEASLGSTSTAYLVQTVTDVAGAYYSLSFELENEVADNASGTPYAGGNVFQVGYNNKSGANTLLLNDTNMAETGVYQSYTLYFYGSGSDTIGFGFENTPSYFELDDVVLKDPPAPGSQVSSSLLSSDSDSLSSAPTPEPSSLALMGTGVLALAGLARRRFQEGVAEQAV